MKQPPAKVNKTQLLERVHYREQQILRVMDLRDEQAYRLALRHLHDTGPHGWGSAYSALVAETIISASRILPKEKSEHLPVIGPAPVARASLEVGRELGGGRVRFAIGLPDEDGE